MNRHFNTRRFTGQQCSQKWRNLLRDYTVSIKITINKNKYIMSDTKLNISTCFLILRILFFIVMESLREEEDGFGRELVREYIGYLERGFGKGEVIIIIKISIIKCLLTFMP